MAELAIFARRKAGVLLKEMAEGGERDFAVSTLRLTGDGGRVRELHGVRIRFGEPDATGRRPSEEVPGSEFALPADLVLLAMGFVHPVHTGLVERLGVALDPRGNVAADTREFATSEPGIFAAGDCRRAARVV